VQIMRADGTRMADIRPLVRVNVWVAVEENGRMESGGAGAGGRVMLDQWLTPESWQSQVDEALRIAVLKSRFGADTGWRDGSGAWRWLARRHAA
jgi:TldD protein